MKSLFRFSIVLTFILMPIQTLALGLWTNFDDGFGANFPNAPERISAAATGGAGYAYQSIGEYNGGSALFAITILPINSDVARDTQEELLNEFNIGFFKSMGKKASEESIKWSKFGDGRTQLNYESDFPYQKHIFASRGFWVIDNHRAIRVSVGYIKGSLASDDVNEVVSFLDSFVLLVK